MHRMLRGSRRIRTFTVRYPLAGPLFWFASLQFFLVQLIVARAWPIPYSLANNTISDLGNTVCGQYGQMYICSPQHNWMNISFILLGLTMVAGSTFIYHEFRPSVGTAWAFGLMALAGVGTVLVGAFPENTVVPLHILGAGLPFLLGNIALIIFGLVLDTPRLFKLYTLLSGVVSLTALGLFLSHHYLWLGIGGMERLTAHPQTIWLILFGIYMIRNHYRTRRTARTHIA